ncbi:MAG: helix-turn-helix transcriptional regulator [Dysosmobacter sp.]
MGGGAAGSGEKTRAIREIKDLYTWEKNKRIITADIHGVAGLGNFSYRKQLASELLSKTHYHRSFCEIHCIMKGDWVTNIIEGEKMESYRLSGGEGLIVYPGETHNSGVVQQGPSEFYAFQICADGDDEILGLDREYSDLLRRQLMHMEYRHVKVPFSYISLLQQAFDLFATGDPLQRRIGVQYLTCFLFQFSRMKPADEVQDAMVSSRIGFALKYIEENYREPISLERLAQEAGYSLSYFESKFLKEMGITLKNYVNKYKVEKAKELLEATDEPIIDLAYRMGWSSSNYFCTVFKKYAGVSPLQYRKLSRAKEETQF